MLSFLSADGQRIQRLSAAGAAADGRAGASAGETASGAAGEGDGDCRHEGNHL